MREFTDESGEVWRAAVQERTGPDYKGRYYFWFEPRAGGEGVALSEGALEQRAHGHADPRHYVGSGTPPPPSLGSGSGFRPGSPVIDQPAPVGIRSLWPIWRRRGSRSGLAEVSPLNDTP